MRRRRRRWGRWEPQVISSVGDGSPPQLLKLLGYQLAGERPAVITGGW